MSYDCVPPLAGGWEEGRRGKQEMFGTHTSYFHSELCRNLSALLTATVFVAPCLSPKCMWGAQELVAGTGTVQKQTCGQESDLCGRSQSCDTSQHREGFTLVQGREAVSWDWGFFEGNWPPPGPASCWAGHFLALEQYWFASSVHIPSSPRPSLSFLWLGFSPVFVIRRLTVTDPKNVPLLHWMTKIPWFYNRAG